MGIRIKEDLIRGADASTTLDEQTTMRVFQVSGLDPVADSRARTVAALLAVDSINPAVKIPQLKDQHPLYPLLVCVNAHTANPSHDNIDVYAMYRYRTYPSQYLKSVNGTLRQVPWPATLDDGVTPILMTYTPAGSSTSVQVPIIYQRQLLNATISFHFLESFVDPEPFNVKYAGAVNSVEWRNYLPRTMMLMPVVGTTDDGIFNSNTYTFFNRPETHDEYVFYIDPLTGQTPNNVMQGTNHLVLDGSKFSGNGWVRLRVAQEVDFNVLFGPKIGY